MSGSLLQTRFRRANDKKYKVKPSPEVQAHTLWNYGEF